MPGYKAQPLAQLDDTMKGPPALPEAGVTGSPDRSEIISSGNQKRQHAKPPRPQQFRETNPEPEPGFLHLKMDTKRSENGFRLFQTSSKQYSS